MHIEPTEQLAQKAKLEAELKTILECVPGEEGEWWMCQGPKSVAGRYSEVFSLMQKEAVTTWWTTIDSGELIRSKRGSLVGSGQDGHAILCWEREWRFLDARLEHNCCEIKAHL